MKTSLNKSFGRLMDSNVRNTNLLNQIPNACLVSDVLDTVHTFQRINHQNKQTRWLWIGSIKYVNNNYLKPNKITTNIL